MDTQSIITLFGGLAVFLFGMKHMSESLQKAAGDNLKSLLGKMTTNKFTAIFSGMTITATIQSSSATTVMVVGFVNAALLSLNQAIGVIMGANIGTTLTAWIVATLGFKFKINAFALPAISIGVAMLFSRREKLRVWGNTLIGFGLMFLGLHFLKSSIPDYKSNPDAFAFLASYADMGFLSVLIFVGIGTLITIIVQSSSTSTAITITLAVKGHIGPELAMAMILGENIGTTITANLAAIAGNQNSKKAAIAHTLFNLFGLIWALTFFYYITDILNSLFNVEQLVDKTSMGYYLSVFHSSFNIANTLMLMWYIPVIERLSNNIIDFFYGKEKKQKNSFKLLSGGSVDTSELALLEISSYNQKILSQALKNFKKVKSLIIEEYSEKKVNAIIEAEDMLDQHRNDILHYLSEIQKAGVTGHAATELLIISERVRTLEQIGDNFADIAKKMKRAHKNGIPLPAESEKQEIENYLNLLKVHYKLAKNALSETNADRPMARKDSESMREDSKRIRKDIEKKIRKLQSAPKKRGLYLILLSDLIHILDNISRCLHETIVVGGE